MQVLYKGTKPDDIEYVGTCTVGLPGVNQGCGTRVKFTRQEATMGPKDLRVESSRAYLEVKCPTCGKQIRSYYEKYEAPSPYYGGRD